MPNNRKNNLEPYIVEPNKKGQQNTLKAVPKPEKNVGADTKGVFYDNLILAGQNSRLNISAIEAFSTISQQRDTVYALLDTMSEDSKVAAVLETYAEDTTETNEFGKIVWCSSDDEDIQKYVTFLLDTLNIDKNIYKWAYSLCKYGDLYLRLYRTSEFKDDLFKTDKEIEEERERKRLDEDINVKVFSKNDNYAHYIEMMPNPAEMYELTKFGKTYAYIQAKITSNLRKTNTSMINSTFQYAFKKKDVNIFDATSFVHAALEDNSSRTPEEVHIFLESEANLEGEGDLSYTVRRGQSLLYSTYKIWRQLMLLENSVLLNRLTKSSIIRLVKVDVGDMPKESVGPHLMGIKQMMEQKMALDTDNALNEYTNPGPIENNIYVPVHEGVGAISIEETGGDVDIKGLADLDYFLNKFYGSLRVPKQYFSETDGATGFNGGTALSLESSRYAKSIKRIQNTLIQAITDAIHLMLLDKGLDSYINKFKLHMVAPTTQEEVNRLENLSNRFNNIRDIVDLTSDIEDISARLKIVKALISPMIDDGEILAIIQAQIDKREVAEKMEAKMNAENMAGSDVGGEGDTFNFDNDFDFSSSGSNTSPSAPAPAPSTETTETSTPDFSADLPSPADLGIDFADSNNEALQ